MLVTEHGVKFQVGSSTVRASDLLKYLSQEGTLVNPAVEGSNPSRPTK